MGFEKEKHVLTITFLFSPVDQDGEDYECAGVLSVHSQDVKQICWHPHKEVGRVSGFTHL